MKRVFWIVSGRFGSREREDAAEYGDKETNTIPSVSFRSYFYVPAGKRGDASL